EYWTEESTEFYDRAWEFRDDGQIIVPGRYLPVFGFLVPFFKLNVWGPDRRSVLEVGCAVGHTRRLLRQEFPDGIVYRGVDISSHHVARARELYPDGDFVLGDAKALDAADAAFTLLIAVDVLLHNWDTAELLGEWWRVAAHGLIFTTRVTATHPTIRARQGEAGIPFHILNQDDLGGLVADLGPDFTLSHVLPLAALGGEVTGLPEGFGEDDASPVTVILLKNLPAPAVTFVHGFLAALRSNPNQS
ncbi:MAG: class I SAM-dependent methyltransferase, partial [Proteobacteria bacterium]|nr:class I SAM-dependent methyltransferase [Pseudomonadota bacterium]